MGALIWLVVMTALVVITLAVIFLLELMWICR
jgi:hypothetical protein